MGKIVKHRLVKNIQKKPYNIKPKDSTEVTFQQKSHNTWNMYYDDEYDKLIKNMGTIQNVVDIDSFTNYFNTNKWISASKSKNYLLKDPLIDWLNIYATKNTNVTHNIAKDNSSTNILFSRGNDFEKYVMTQLKKNRHVTTVLQNYKDLSAKTVLDTYKLMKNGEKIIYQGAIANPYNSTYGIPDLMIRSDEINALFKNQILDESETQIKAPLLDGEYHYVIVDIKMATLQLCASGNIIRNEEMTPANKGQLAIYTSALQYMQGYAPTKAYVLGNGYVVNSTQNYERGHDCFNRLGVIDYGDKDNKYVAFTRNGIRWYKDVLEHGMEWTLEPTPTRAELHPNMKNTRDDGWGEFKKQYAMRIHEPTLFYRISVDARNIGLSKGITKWTDPNCTTANLEINGKTAETIDALLNINRQSQHILLPEKLLNNKWLHDDKLEFYIDYETINDVLYDNFNHSGTNIFLIGMGYIENNNWKYRYYCANRYDKNEFERIFTNFINDMYQIILNYKMPLKTKNGNEFNVVPKIYHWSNAEYHQTNTIAEIIDRDTTDVLTYCKWIDLCKIFTDEPIVVKNAFNFKLKSIVTALHSHGLVSTKWDSNGVKDGLGAMNDAIAYYKSVDKYINNTHDTELKHFDNTKMHNIIKYNEIDCESMYEIMCLLRNKYK